MSFNKIFFAYPALYKDSMTREDVLTPAPIIFNVPIGSKNTVVVNVGMMIAAYLNEPITIRAEVYPIDKPQQQDEPIKDDGKFEHIQTIMLNPNQGIFLSSLHVENVLFSEPGVYEIRIKLLKIEDSDQENEILLDELKSSFYVLTRDGD